MKFGILSQYPKVYSTNTLVQACLKNKIAFEVLNYNKTDISFENGVPVVYYLGKKMSDIDAIIPRIKPSMTVYGTTIVRQFEMMNVYCLNKSLDFSIASTALSLIQVSGPR